MADALLTQAAADPPVVNIVGERVALGPLRRELVPWYHRWRNDFEVQRTFGDEPRPVTLEERHAWFERQAVGGDAVWFTIYETATWRSIGTTDLFDLDQRHRSAAFGMLIGEAVARGRGLGTETARLVLDYAFTALGLHSVHLETDEFNRAARRAYAKAGFREVGRRREATRFAGRWWDLILMDCLAAEFASPVLGRLFLPDHPGIPLVQSEPPVGG